jgi:hypothetical protein
MTPFELPAAPVSCDPPHNEPWAGRQAGRPGNRGARPTPPGRRAPEGAAAPRAQGAPAGPASDDAALAARLARASDDTLEAAIVRMVRELVLRAERSPTAQERARRRTRLESLIDRL